MFSLSTIVRRGNICLRQDVRSIFNQKWETYILSSPCENVLHVQINRPEKRNAMNTTFWSKPVIAVIHGACIGGGLDLICATDIRYCTRDAWFQAKELELGIAPDVGTIQRMPRITGNESLARELIYTARRFEATEAYQLGLVSCLSDTHELALEKAFETGERIAALSPVAVQATKSSLLFSRDHSVQEGLSHLADLNQVMLQSEDVPKSVQAIVLKVKPTFSDA